MRRCASSPGSSLQRLNGGRDALASATVAASFGWATPDNRVSGDCRPNASRVVITSTEMMTSVHLRGRGTPACGRAAYHGSRFVPEPGPLLVRLLE